jgi:hypothetical protein
MEHCCTLMGISAFNSGEQPNLTKFLLCVWHPKGEHVVTFLQTHVVLSFFHLSVTSKGKSYLVVLELLCCSKSRTLKTKKKLHLFSNRTKPCPVSVLKFQHVLNARFPDWRVGWFKPVPWSPVPYSVELYFISVMYVICEKEVMLLWLQSLQMYLAVPEMKSVIPWMLCLYSQPLTGRTLRLTEDVIKHRGFLYVLEKVCYILNAKSSFLMTLLF